MKKLIFMLCLIFALSICTAFAETTAADTASAEEKIILWDHMCKEVDENGKEFEQPVKVTLTLKTPVEIEPLENVDIADGYFAKMSRGDLAPVTVTITPADIKAHANLNEATDEQLQLYIDMVAAQYEEGKVQSEIRKTESGNVYLSVGDEKIRSVWQIYEDTLIEIIQFHDDFEDLTTEDQNFAIEILQGLWME